MRQQMNIAHFEPIRVRGVDASGNEDTGVGAEKIDLAVAFNGFGNQHLDVRFAPDVDAHTHAAGIGCYFFSTLDIDIGHNHRSRAFLVESSGQRFADSACCPGYYDNFVLNLHDLSFYVDHGAAANLACQDLLAQLEYFTQRLDLNHGIEGIHRQVGHNACPNLDPLRVRHS